MGFASCLLASAVLLLCHAPSVSGAYTYVSQVGCSCRFPETLEECAPIESMADCRSAAGALGVTYAADFELQSNHLPGGCYVYKDYILYWNEYTNVTGDWYQGFLRHSLCELVTMATTTPDPTVTFDCEQGVPRTLLPQRRTNTCQNTAHEDTCVFECIDGYRNKEDYSVRCDNGTFVLADPNATCSPDLDNDGFEFDMDDGEVSDTASNQVTGCASAEAGSPVYSTVFGGRRNTASGCKALVVGGEDNTAIGNEAVVGGGSNNHAPSHMASVGGGQSNTADGTGSVVVGGALNVIGDQGTHNFVGGGYDNDAPGDKCAIAGGWANRVHDARDSATVAGGRECFAKGTYSAVSGGWRNTAVATSSSIGGGYLNAVVARYAAVAGGSRNTVKGKSSTAIGHRGFVTQDNALVLAFKGEDCDVRSTKQVGMCAEHIYVNGVDLIDELLTGSLYSRRNRQLSAAELAKDAEDAVVLAQQNAEATNANELDSALRRLQTVQAKLAANENVIAELLQTLQTKRF